MSLKIERDISVTIDGADVKMLSDLLELSRRYIAGDLTYTAGLTKNKFLVEYGFEYGNEMMAFLDNFFDGVGDI